MYKTNHARRLKVQKVSAAFLDNWFKWEFMAPYWYEPRVANDIEEKRWNETECFFVYANSNLIQLHNRTEQPTDFALIKMFW